MTVSTHSYGAVVTPAWTPVSVVGGSVTLDASAIPHVAGELTFAVADVGLLDELDPRDGARVSLYAVRQDEDLTARFRLFDLGVREVTPDRAAGTVSVRLASDEAVLGDVAPLADDAGARAHEASLRGVCDYVLGTIGAHLEPGTLDADVTARWAVTNAIHNALADTTSGFNAGTNANSVATASSMPPILGSAYVFWRSVTAGLSYLNLDGQLSVTSGEPVTARAFMSVGDAAGNGFVMVRFFNNVGGVISDVTGAPVMLSAAWKEVTHTMTAPAGAVRAQLYLGFNAPAAAQSVRCDAPLLISGSEVVPPFSGSSAATAEYEYSYAAAVAASASIRTPL
ncbi:hypothetical protein, partial [Microbacterium sp. 69-10]|uniref:hypothetical protein n=1 Tax=Microbacterium sp. 69-10 TaxID=1895783 RepID=UPI0025E12F9B